MCGRWREEVCVRVCVCVFVYAYVCFVTHNSVHVSVRVWCTLSDMGLSVWNAEHADFCQRYPGCGCSLPTRSCLCSSLSGRRVRLVVCSQRGDTRVKLLMPSDECSGYCFIPQHRRYQANLEFARFAFQIRSPCKSVTNLLSLDCKNVHAVYHQSAFYLRWSCENEFVCVYKCVSICFYLCSVCECVCVCVCIMQACV